MRVHMVLKNDPQLAQEVQNSPAGGAVSGALDAHVREHLAFVFRKQIEEELGITLPPAEEQLPPRLESQLAKLVADAADQMMGKKQQQQQAEQAAQQQQDPIVQMREREVATLEQEQQRKQAADQAKQQIDLQKLDVERQKIAAKERTDMAELSLEEQALKLKSEIESEKLDADLEIKGFELGLKANQDRNGNNNGR